MTHGPAPASRQRQQQQQQLVSDIEHTSSKDDLPGLPTPPDGGWGWMVVLASFSIHIVTDGLTYSFGIFYSEFLTYFNEGKGYTAWIASILVGVTLCSGPISSSLVNRYGCRAVTIAGALLASASLAVSMYATSVFMLFITIGLGTGLGLGLIYLPAIVSVTMYFERLRSLATGIAVCGSGLGTSIFAPLTETLIKRYQWQGAMLAIAGIVLICVVFGWMFRPLTADDGGGKSRDLEGATFPLQHSNTAPLGEPKQTADGETSNLTRSNSYGILGGNTPRINLNANGHSVSGDTLDKRPAPVGGGQLVDEVKRLRQSQPLLAGGSATAEQQPGQALKRAESGTMYRKDALYTGSVHNMASRHPSQTTLSEYEKGSYGSVVQGTGPRSRHQRGSVAPETADPDTERCLGCVPCSRETCDTFREMMNFSILRDPVFIVFTVSNFLTSIGFNVPYVYLTEQALAIGIDTQHSSYLIGIIGIANTVGRIVLGYISDKPWVNRLAVYNCSLTVCGVATACSVLCTSYESLAVYSAVFGFTIGAYVGLTSVILVDLLGLEKLTNAFGLLLLFQGIASFLGPPIAGWLYDFTLSYGPGFLMAGSTIAISGVMLFAIPLMQRCAMRRTANGDRAITAAAHGSS
ncbi:monocarboxylate transporter 12 [Anopheles bellator]|uniref:monocarboxylate transporter 12 n=1 Tax=Anopheles bellator TaxID=139047 RepID=UPI0026495650|nr:monocarboxylate transporter 12 [Anopheles bellator]XP_058064044.1 monocarboxylate transporter 12 [Anopheles bellator]XP_058064045.1 monocarboxylate transporter 12 [Anopheles bellator]XP_058064047.1 monocarboxylate transporter 12 [Anopheles bellator]